MFPYTSANVDYRNMAFGIFIAALTKSSTEKSTEEKYKLR